MLDDIHASLPQCGLALLITGLHAQPLVALARAGRLERLGRENVAVDLDEALEKARGSLEREGRG